MKIKNLMKLFVKKQISSIREMTLGDAVRILLPVNRCRSIVVGTEQKTRNQLVEEAADRVMALCQA